MKISLLGTGLMGQAIGRRLLDKGHDLAVYNRTQEKTKTLAAKGARVAGSPQEAIRASSCALLMLADFRAIESVLFQNLCDLEARTIIQMGTIAPQESISIHARVAAGGGEYCECPVLGSRKEAASGKLILMFGGRPEQWQRWEPLLAALGDDRALIGSVGQAAALKLALNQLIASLMGAFSLSLGMIEKSGVDINLFMDILRSSALYAPMFDKKMSRLIDRHYADPNFPIKHLLKDVDLILAECRPKGLYPRHLEGVREILTKTLAGGRADQDYSALHETISPP